jgi:nucleotide-binding universal stress UspA family protein
MPGLGYRTVVVPTDFSDFSLAAVDTALQIVPDKAHLHVFHAQQNVASYEAAIDWGNMVDDACAKAEKSLHEMLPGEKFKGVQVAVRAGDPGHEIAKYAQEVNADLIVMPSHGRRGFSHLLIGSVTERVVRLAHCPVLVLKTTPSAANT